MSKMHNSQESGACSPDSILELTDIKLLFMYLKNKNPKISQAALVRLCDLEDPAAIKLLKDFLNGLNREKAAQLLYKLAHQYAIGALIECLNHNNYWVRKITVEVLGMLAHLGSAAPLIKAIAPLFNTLQDKNHEVREKVVNTLITIGKKSPNEFLENLNIFFHQNYQWIKKTLHAETINDYQEGAFLSLFFSQIITNFQQNSKLNQKFSQLIQEIKNLLEFSETYFLNKL
ncbi:MAG: HEAT repeat domain-containing protein [Candidatus Helarchaeota archaeon]